MVAMLGKEKAEETAALWAAQTGSNLEMQWGLV